MTNQDRVREFHQAFGLPVLSHPRVPSPDRVGLRRSLLREESDEALVEFSVILRATTSPFETPSNLQEQNALGLLAKELADVLYVTYGAAAEFGIDLDAVMAEVHDSNMSKLDKDGRAIRREDGKVLKSDRYRQPDIRKVLGL